MRRCSPRWRIRPCPSCFRWQGTGPFSIAEIGPGRIVLEAQPAHWGRRARLARIVFIESADEAQAEAAVSAQSLDVLFPAGVPSRLSGALSIPSWRIGYVALQTEKEPFKRLKARRALAAALDPAQIAPALGPAASPLQAFLPRGVWGRRDGPLLMGADHEQAKRLLVDAGLAPGASATLLVADAGNGIDQAKLAEAIRASLAAAGFCDTRQTESTASALSGTQPRVHPMALATARVEAGDPHFVL